MAAVKTPFKRNGRKRLKIDWEKVKGLIISGCTGTRTASALGIHYQTLYDHCEKDQKMGWGEFYRMHSEKGEATLVATQYEVAIKNKNVNMLIWLGKTRLGQTDKTEIETTGDKPSVNIFIPDNSRDILETKEEKND
jgi:hypothetical protein